MTNVLPVLGAMYWLRNSESEHFVHPAGGSDNPEDGSALLYHIVDRRPNLRFKFVKLGNTTYLQHVTSGKYIHTAHIDLSNNSVLVVHSGTPNAVSGLELVKVDGYTYIRSTVNRNFYIHPRGGVAGQDCELVWHEGPVRPGLAISIVPAEDYQVVSMEFDANDRLTEGVLVAVQDGPTNRSATTDLSCSTTVSYSESVNNEFTFSFSQELGVQVTTTFSAGVSLANASTQVQFSAKFGAEQTTTKSTSETVSVSITRSYTLKPMQWGRLVLTTKKKSGKIPFKATFRSARGHEFVENGTMDVKYFFNTKDVLETGPAV